MGPHADEIEPGEFLGVAATTAELGVVVALVTMLRGHAREWILRALLILGAAPWALTLLGFLS